MHTKVFGEGDLRLLLLASTGGHLSQLKRLAPRHGASRESLWVTFDTPQSRYLLEGENVLWLDYIAPRDLKATYRAFRRLTHELNGEAFDGALSTGAAVAVSGFMWAKRNHVDSVYIESCSRMDGPSLTGPIVSALRLARTFTQHHSWADKRWLPVQSVLNEYSKVSSTRALPSESTPRKILVTLGAIQPYRFDRMIDAVLPLLRPDDQVTWQVGHTSRSDLPGSVHTMLPTNDFDRIALESDIVITHAGIGTLLKLMEDGISPVVIPRRRERNEHVDNHQLQAWGLLSRNDIAVAAEPETLTEEHLREAQRTATTLRITL